MNNIAGIQRQLVEKDLDALLITDEKNQRYAAGFPFTDGAVLVTRERAYLITDSRYIEAAEKAADENVCVQLFDGQHPLMSRLLAALKENGVRRLAAEEQKLSHGAWVAYEKRLGLELLPSQDILGTLRASKSEEEIACMIRAQRISEAALAETLPLIKPGMTEKEVAAELVYRMLRHGSEGNSFDPIVVTGEKTSMPHGVPGDKVIREGDFVTMDFGSLSGGYCSDMTRTVAVGSATEEMKNVYAIVLKAQLAGIAAARAGIPGKVIDGAARKVIEDAGYGQYFIHRTGHGIGLETHEPADVSAASETITRPGMCFSVEPGVYLPGKFGVRVEDLVAVTEHGGETLNKLDKEFVVIKP